ncbi:unnamed protein product [Caenorhabditis brenneri]
MSMMKSLLLVLVVLSIVYARAHHKHPHHHHHHEFVSSEAAPSGSHLVDQTGSEFDFRAGLKDKDPQADLEEALYEFSKTPFVQLYRNPLNLKPSPQDPKIQLTNKTSADFHENQIKTTPQFECHRDVLHIASQRCRSSCEHEFDLLTMACDENGPTKISAFTFFSICCPHRMKPASDTSIGRTKINNPTKLVEKYLSDKYSSEESDK